MSNQHPITPPLELVKQWWNEAQKSNDPDIACWLNYVATQAARWGADQELEACCEWLDRNNQWARCDIDELHDGRRPKPQSLKEQALALVNGCNDPDTDHLDDAALDTIRRALEALPDD